MQHGDDLRQEPTETVGYRPFSGQSMDPSPNHAVSSAKIIAKWFPIPAIEWPKRSLQLIAPNVYQPRQD